MRVYRPTYRFLGPILAIVAALATSGCDGGGDEEGEGEGGGEDDVSAWITGEWSGSLQGKEEGEDGSSLVEPTSVDAKFTSVNAKTGSFTFKMTDLDNVEVTGTFSDFAGKTKSLLLKIKDSKYSPLGMPGSTTDLEYTLYGDDLELSNTSVLLKLIRKDGGSEGGDGGGDDGGDVPPTGYIDDWSCGDTAGRTWKVSLGSDNTFYMKVFDTPSPTVTLAGNYTIEKDLDKDVAVMVVAESNPTNYEGQQFTARLESENSMQLSRMIRNDNNTSRVGESFPCSRE